MVFGWLPEWTPIAQLLSEFENGCTVGGRKMVSNSCLRWLIRHNPLPCPLSTARSEAGAFHRDPVLSGSSLTRSRGRSEMDSNYARGILPAIGSMSPAETLSADRLHATG